MKLVMQTIYEILEEYDAVSSNICAFTDKEEAIAHLGDLYRADTAAVKRYFIKRGCAFAPEAK